MTPPTPTQSALTLAKQCLNIHSEQNICNFQRDELLAVIDALTAGTEGQAMTEPTQAQIDAALRAYSEAGAGHKGGMIAALTAAAEVQQRVLNEADAFCPSCGHNRDKSCVSSIDHGTFKSCQKCGATWTEIPAAIRALSTEGK